MDLFLAYLVLGIGFLIWIDLMFLVDKIRLGRALKNPSTRITHDHVEYTDPVSGDVFWFDLERGE